MRIRSAVGVLRTCRPHPLLRGSSDGGDRGRPGRPGGGRDAAGADSTHWTGLAGPGRVPGAGPAGRPASTSRHDLLAYAGQLAARPTTGYLPLDLTVRPDAAAADVLQVVTAAGAAARPTSRPRRSRTCGLARRAGRAGRVRRVGCRRATLLQHLRHHPGSGGRLAAARAARAVVRCGRPARRSDRARCSGETTDAGQGLQQVGPLAAWWSFDWRGHEVAFRVRGVRQPR